MCVHWALARGRCEPLWRTALNPLPVRADGRAPAARTSGLMSSGKRARSRGDMRCPCRSILECDNVLLGYPFKPDWM